MAERRVSILAVLEDRLSRPLGTIIKRFDTMKRGVKGVTAALAPLNNKLLQLGGALTGLAAGRKALDTARQQVIAEQSLLAALGGRRAELERIKTVASEIQSLTTVGDEALLETASLLTRMGVAAELVPSALRAATDTAAALQVKLPLVAKGIAKALTVGQLAPNNQIPFLKQLLDDGAEGVEILKGLTTAFGGAGAALAEGPFGKIDQLSNTIGDSFEEIGKVLVEFVLPVMEGVAEVTEDFVEFLGDPKVKVFIDLMLKLAPILVGIAVSISAVLGASAVITVILPGLTAIAGIIGTIASAVAGLVLSIGLWPAIISIIVVRLLVMVGAWDKIKGAVLSAGSGIRSTVGDIIELFKAVIDGRADFESLFELIVTRLSLIKLLFRRSILIPASATFIAVRDIITGTVDAVVGYALTATLLFIDKFLELIDGAVNIAIDALSLLGFEFNKATLGKELDASVDKFARKAEEGGKRAASAIGIAFRTIKDEIEDIDAEIGENIRSAAEIVAKAEEKAFDRAKENIIQEGEEAISQIIRLDAAIGAALDRAGGISFDAGELFENLDLATIREALSGLNKETQAELTKIIQAELEVRLASERLTAAEFFKLRTDLIKQVTAAEIEGVEEAIDEKESLIEQLQRQQTLSEDYLRRERETLQAQEDAGKVVEERREQLEKIKKIQDGLIESNLDEKQAAEDLIVLTNERARLEVERAAFEQSQSATRRSLADAIIAEMDEARSVLETQRSDIANAILTGEILPTQGIELSSRALADFNSTIDELRQEIVDLTIVQSESEAAALNMAIGFASFGIIAGDATAEVTKELDDLIAKLDKVQKKANESAPEGGFFAGLREGISKTANVLGNFGIQGAKIGAQLITDFGKGLVDVWIDGEKSFSDFAKGFLANIARMIAETLVFKAISSALSFIPGFGGTTPAAAQGGLFTGSSFIPAFAEGGYVPGAHTRKDDVNAKLMAGEYVTDYNTVKHYGVNFFAALKRRMIPRGNFGAVASAPPTPKTHFATGGQVVATGNTGGVSRAVVVSDEQSFDRMLRGGSASLLEILAENGIRPVS